MSLQVNVRVASNRQQHCCFTWFFSIWLRYECYFLLFCLFTCVFWSCITLSFTSFLSCRPAKSPSTLFWEHAVDQTIAESWNFSRVQIHGHVQPSLVVPVKCALALMNWHCFIPPPHLSLLLINSPAPFHARTHTFLSLPELWVLLTKGINGPTSQHHTHLYHKTCTWINLSF